MGTILKFIFLPQHEQELETQRLSQKLLRLEEQLAESQENELKSIRELEQLKLDIHRPASTSEMVRLWYKKQENI